MTVVWHGPVDIDAENGQTIIGSSVGGDVIYSQRKYLRGRPAQYLSSDEIAARVSCYVPSGHDGKVADQLRLCHAVGLYGPAGSGRETTAIAMMRQLSPDLPIRRFSLGDEDPQEISDAGPYGYLIRFEEGKETDLGVCAENIRASGGYLVAMAMDSASVENFAWVPVESPPAREVFRRLVTFRDLPQWADWDRAQALLEDHLPGDARRLADLVVRATGTGQDQAWQQSEVERAYLGWNEELRAWFSVHESPLERILLLAAIIVPGGTDEAFVYDAAAKLAESLGPETNGGGLAWCPVTRLREMLEADRGRKSVTFRRIGYAEAALRYAFADYPLARPELFDWLAALPQGAGAVGPDVRLAVAVTFAELAAEYGEADRITSAALGWARADLPGPAYGVLSATCLHARVGGAIRKALYDWSRTPRLPVTLKLVVAQTCELLGETLPTVALTRLKHLATWGGSQVIAQVVDSAVTIADRGHQDLVLDAALDWCAVDSHEVLPPAARQRRRRAGAMLFLRLAERVDVVGYGRTLGWRAAIDFRDHHDTDQAALARVFGIWLDTALTDDHLGDAVVATFLSAGSPRLIPDAAGAWRARPDRSEARFVIALADAWASGTWTASGDRVDPARAVLADRIAIPLTHPWWRRVLRIIRARIRASRRSRASR
jgi:hypothetical protein